MKNEILIRRIRQYSPDDFAFSIRHPRNRARSPKYDAKIIIFRRLDKIS